MDFPVITFSTTEVGDSETNITEEITTDDTRTGSAADTFDTTTYDTETGSTVDTFGTTTGSEYATTDDSSKSEYSKEDSEVSQDRESFDSEWNELNFLLPQDICNLDSRRIRAEDPHWALSPVPELATLIIRATKFIQGPGLPLLKENAETEQWKQILEVLPLTLPFPYTLSVIEDGVYWMRQCLERWPASEVWKFGDSWKMMLVERIVQDEIENFKPEESEIKELEKFLHTFKNYDFRLQIQKLVRIEKKPFVVDLELEDFDDFLDEFINEPEVHTSFLNLETVLSCLINLKEFSFILAPSSLDPETHQLSVTDFNSLFRGVKKLGKLEKFRCSNGVTTNLQLNILARHFVQHRRLTELNMSFNFIDDDYCDVFGQLLISPCPLKVLVLKYNRISDRGAITIATALTVNKKLRKLDISLNWIGNKGGSFLAKVISSNLHLEDLDISNNKLGHQAGLSFAEVLKISKQLRSLNLSDNNIGEDAGSELLKAMEENSTILDLGIKFCNISLPDEDAIYRAIIRNRASTYAADEDDSLKRLKF
ncbi:Dynein regulatory complex subunit 5 like protein [Argiope bruennichi]|uniref:Dynein regulatory complex subunit 5 like protein n=1 Tax=Argiope bruennichi TaxID=94029 RepID=A0A8T0EDP7_ARGBR|nr:Dynein regulatory complex subunit 5 like protein [Argiope bruennichi]